VIETKPDLSKISGNKFHRICFEISVAFETTFPDDVEANYSADFAFPDLIHKNPDETVIRVHSPAVSVGDVIKDGKAMIQFVPWVEEGHAIFHRLCFRLQPLTRMSNQCRRVMFARFNETAAFGFELSRRGGNFISLNFHGYDAVEFIPVFLKAEVENGSFKYFKISAEATDDAVTVTVEEVSESDAPAHLKSALK
jgi:hypothetical protein